MFAVSQRLNLVVRYILNPTLTECRSKPKDEHVLFNMKIWYSVCKSLLYTQPLGTRVCWADVSSSLVWQEAHWCEWTQRAWVHTGEGGGRETEAKRKWPSFLFRKASAGKCCTDLRTTGKMLPEESMTFNGFLWVKHSKMTLYLSHLEYQ